MDVALHKLVLKQQVVALNARKIDVNLLRVSINPRIFEVTPVVREPMMLAVPGGHRLAVGRVPSLRDLGESVWLHSLLSTPSISTT